MKNPLHSTPLLRNVLTARAGYIAGRAGETTRRSAKTPLLMLTGAGAGAALMYIFDPQQGRRRRAIARDKLAHSSRVAGERAQATWKDVRQRSYGLYAEGRRLFRKGQVSDDTLQARVRAKLGRYTRYSHAIDTSVRDGVVTLSGHALAQDVDRLIAQVARLRGVQAIENRLEVHEDAANISALQGVYDAPSTEAQWTPTQRVAAGAAGTSLLVGGLLRRGPAGFALGALGAGLLACGALHGARRDRTPQRRGEKPPAP